MRSNLQFEIKNSLDIIQSNVIDYISAGRADDAAAREIDICFDEIQQFCNKVGVYMHLLRNVSPSSKERVIHDLAVRLRSYQCSSAMIATFHRVQDVRLRRLIAVLVRKFHDFCQHNDQIPTNIAAWLREEFPAYRDKAGYLAYMCMYLQEHLEHGKPSDTLLQYMPADEEVQPARACWSFKYSTVVALIIVAVVAETALTFGAGFAVLAGSIGCALLFAIVSKEYAKWKEQQPDNTTEQNGDYMLLTDNPEEDVCDLEQGMALSPLAM